MSQMVPTLELPFVIIPFFFSFFTDTTTLPLFQIRNLGVLLEPCLLLLLYAAYHQILLLLPSTCLFFHLEWPTLYPRAHPYHCHLDHFNLLLAGSRLSECWS